MLRPLPLLAAVLLLPGCAMIRGDRPATAAETPKSPVAETAEKAGEIATQPVRDLGADKPEIPPALVRATENPYSLAGLNTCAALAAEIAELTTHLGPDYLLVADSNENKAEKIAEAGGKAVVNSIIPFRGLVRELTGAAAAQRRYDDAVDAGFARRGFLRGVHSTKGCPPTGR